MWPFGLALKDHEGRLALAAVVGLGLVMASCSRGPSATEAAACSAILKVALPPGIGESREGTSVGIAIPANLVENLIHSGDPTLTRDGRAIVSANGRGFVKAFDEAQTECRMAGA
jgi:hypothetical protein